MKKLALITAGLMLLAISFQSCASRHGCSTKGKARTEMGWM
jgi:hypothetical protein